MYLFLSCARDVFLEITCYGSVKIKKIPCKNDVRQIWMNQTKNPIVVRVQF